VKKKKFLRRSSDTIGIPSKIGIGSRGGGEGRKRLDQPSIGSRADSGILALGRKGGKHYSDTSRD